MGAPASDHGVHIDTMLYITIAITGIVFFITQVVLFWFSYKYQESDKRKAYYYPHNNKLEADLDRNSCHCTYGAGWIWYFLLV